jgi:RNA polymerase sigma-70 factor, ECF subfamily
MDDEQLTKRFERERPRLLAVATRMLGSSIEAQDAVQEAWLRLERTARAAEGPAGIDELGAWLTTVVTRISLNVLRSRRQRAESPLELLDSSVVDPIVAREPAHDPEHEAVLADSVGVAMLVVLEALSPDERVAFVLHDMFAVPFDQVARMLDRTPASARQLATRARRRVRGRAASGEGGAPDAGSARRQRRVVDAFFAAARGGDFDALMAVLHPDVVFRIDAGPGSPASVALSGARKVAGQAAIFGPASPAPRPALVNGMPGAVVIVGGRLLSVSSFTLRDGLVVAVDALTDPARLAGIDVSCLLA